MKCDVKLFLFVVIFNLNLYRVFIGEEEIYECIIIIEIVCWRSYFWDYVVYVNINMVRINVIKFSGLDCVKFNSYYVIWWIFYVGWVEEF